MFQNLMSSKYCWLLCVCFWDSFWALYAVHRFSMLLASYSFFVKRERWNKWLQVMLSSLLISQFQQIFFVTCLSVYRLVYQSMSTLSSFSNNIQLSSEHRNISKQTGMIQASHWSLLHLGMPHRYIYHSRKYISLLDQTFHSS